MDTQKMTEIELRYLQLEEIRAMLKLPKNATHESVIRVLHDIGTNDRRIDLSKLPARYERILQFGIKK